MNELHNELMAYVLDFPEEAAREIQRLRKAEARYSLDSGRIDFITATIAFFIGVFVGAAAL